MNIDAIVLPTKGLEYPTLRLLSEAGIIVTRDHSRSVETQVSGLAGVKRAFFCRASEIPRLVSEGTIPLGITGRDMLRKFEDHQDTIRFFDDLPYSRSSKVAARGVFFTRCDDPVVDVNDLIHAIEKGGRIATEYPPETSQFVYRESCETLDPRLECWSNSVEVAVVTGRCRFGVALVETGQTLADNNLREIEGGTVFTSGAVLIANRALLRSNKRILETARELSIRLTQALASRKP
jgi:ATP phosphoribosyltransferase